MPNAIHHYGSSNWLCEIGLGHICGGEVTESAHAELVALARRLNEQELQPLLHMARRFVRGREVYGAYNPKTDQRDMRAELLEELIDGVFYLSQWKG